MATVLFSHGIQSKYDALVKSQSVDNNTLYFITDTQRIYKGCDLVAKTSAFFVDALPTFEDAIENVIYVVATTEAIRLYLKNSVFNDSEFICVGGSTLQENSISDIKLFDDSILTRIGETFSTTDDSTIPTTGAVATAISEGLKDYNGALVDVDVKRNDNNDGSLLIFTAKDGTEHNVTIKDLFLSGAEYDANTHILSLTVTGQDDPVEVNLESLVPQAVSTADVQLSDTIVTTVAVGNIKKGTTIAVTDLQSFLINMLSSDSWGTVTNPSVKLTELKSGNYEVGSKVIPTYTATFNAGSYAQTAANDQVATGITTNIWTVSCTGQTTQTDGTADTPSGKTTISGSFDEITVVDDTNVQIKAEVTHTAGANPKSYLSKDEVDGVTAASKAIKAGTVSVSDNTKITGFRKSFYYVGTDHTTAIDTAFVRGSKATSTSGASNDFNVDTATDAAKTKSLHIPAGTTRVMLAVPGTKTLSSVIDVLGMGLDVVGNFNTSTVQVAGADGVGNLKDYTIFETVNANGLAETYYAITIA